MTLDEAIADLEGGFQVHPEIGNYAWCAAREPYVTVCSGDKKADGAPIPAWCASEALAIKLWHFAAKEYAKKKSGMLYWRTRPEIESKPPEAEYDIARFCVYSRLVITDKPQVCEQVLTRETV